MTFSGRRASQDPVELQGFISLLRARGVKRYGEIGAREGDTFHEVMMKVECTHGVAVDLPGALWGKSTTARSLERSVGDLNRLGKDARFFLGNSQDPFVWRAFAHAGPYDAILIDGDHTLEGVTADWETYRDFAPLIAFHDIVGDGQFEKVTRRKVEVPTLWSRIKAERYNVVQFVAPGSKMGIGCVLKG